MAKITVLGIGSWGTALSRVLLDNKHCVTVWSNSAGQLEELRRHGENKTLLPGCVLTGDFHVADTLEQAVSEADYVLNSVPTQFVREVFSKKPPIATDTVIVNAAKGLEIGTHKRISEIVADYYPNHRYAVISGPSHAEEVGKRMPTTLVAACEVRAISEAVQDLFITDYLRVYAHPDVKGVEISSALKNVIAIAAGIADGLGYGDNALAALMTRGIAEIKRLGHAVGAMPETFDGLAGIGDLIVTCMSNHSRNRRCGQLLGKGYTIEEAVKTIGMAVEGVSTILAAEELRCIHTVEMPIVEQLYGVLYQGESPEGAVKKLMGRAKRHELEEAFHDSDWQY